MDRIRNQIYERIDKQKNMNANRRIVKKLQLNVILKI